MKAQRFVIDLPYFSAVVVLLVLTGCTTVGAATLKTGPIPTETIPLPLSPTLATFPTPQEAITPENPAVDSASALSPATPQTLTPVPSATPVPSPTATRGHDLLPEQRILVNQDDQVMFVYENDIVVRTIPVSTGAPVTNMFTPPWQGIVGDDWGRGPFRNQQLADFKWFLFPGPEGSILIHSVPYTIINGLKVYDRTDALGIEPVSNGCIRISPEDAVWLKSWGPVGVPITITRWSGKILPPETISSDVTGEEINNE